MTILLTQLKAAIRRGVNPRTGPASLPTSESEAAVDRVMREVSGYLLKVGGISIMEYAEASGTRLPAHTEATRLPCSDCDTFHDSRVECPGAWTRFDVDTGAPTVAISDPGTTLFFDCGNKLAKNGVHRCDCGVKYWRNDRCVDCHKAINMDDYDAEGSLIGWADREDRAVGRLADRLSGPLSDSEAYLAQVNAECDHGLNVEAVGSGIFVCHECNQELSRSRRRPSGRRGRERIHLVADEIDGAPTVTAYRCNVCELVTLDPESPCHCA